MATLYVYSVRVRSLARILELRVGVPPPRGLLARLGMLAKLSSHQRLPVATDRA